MIYWIGPLQHYNCKTRDAIEGKGEIDLERAKKAYERARKRIEKKDSDTDMKRAQLALQRAIIRIHVYEE